MKLSIHAGGRVRVEQGDGVAVLTVCRPEVHNALDLETIEALGQFVQGLSQKPQIRAVVLAGEGDGAFIGGGDLRKFAALRGEEAGAALSLRVGKILDALERAPQISLSAIEGSAFGGGVEVALACDMRVMSQSAKLVFAQRKFGVCSGWGASARLAKLIGYSRALECFLFGRSLDADEAHRLGLANRVVAPTAALPTALEMAQELAQLDRSLALGIKRVVWAGAYDDPDDAAAVERKVFAELWGSANHERLVQRFLERASKDKSEPPQATTEADAEGPENRS
jgi:enoyl-CoA hydratase